jgi:hypothetical protein
MLEELVSDVVPNCTNTTSYVTIVPASCKDTNTIHYCFPVILRKYNNMKSRRIFRWTQYYIPNLYYNNLLPEVN